MERIFVFLFFCAQHFLVGVVAQDLEQDLLASKTHLTNLKPFGISVDTESGGASVLLVF